MDFKEYYKRYEVENIHWDIFKETSDYKNYCLGVAQGVYFTYKILNKVKDKNISIEEIMKGIELSIKDEEKINEYFFRLLKDLEDK